MDLTHGEAGHAFLREAETTPILMNYRPVSG